MLRTDEVVFLGGKHLNWLFNTLWSARKTYKSHYIGVEPVVFITTTKEKEAVNLKES